VNNSESADNKVMRAKPGLHVSHHLSNRAVGCDFNQQDPSPSTFVLLLRRTKHRDHLIAVDGPEIGD